MSYIGVREYTCVILEIRTFVPPKYSSQEINSLEILFIHMLVMFISCSFCVNGSPFTKDKYLFEKKSISQQSS